MANEQTKYKRLSSKIEEKDDKYDDDEEEDNEKDEGKEEVVIWKLEVNEMENKMKKLEDDNFKLMEEQKKMQLEIQQLKTENKELRVNNIDLLKKEWDWKQILLWIMSLEHGRYSKYEVELRENLKKEKIFAEDLVEVNESDISRDGILITLVIKRV